MKLRRVDMETRKGMGNERTLKKEGGGLLSEK